MDNAQNIGIQFSNKVIGQDKLEKYEKTLKSIQNLTVNMSGAKIDGGFTQSITVADGAILNLNNSLNKTDDIVNKAFQIGKIPAFIKTLTTIKEKMAQLVDKSALYIENMNLLDVAYNNNTKSAKKLISRMTEMYGLDESWGYRTVGLFKQLSNAMGLADETGTKLANTLTMLAIDLSSLYNTDTTEAVTKLTSMLSGQTRAIRSFGADVTMATLQQTLFNNGINVSINTLSIAEKRLVAVTSVLEQTKSASNDWARTINCGLTLKNVMQNFVNLCKKGVSIIKILANGKSLCY